MRQLLPFVFLFVLFSCSENRYVTSVFDHAEALMSSSPDSSLMLVRRIDGQSLPTKGLRARHALLLTMALDKCYIDVVEDSTILVAYDYFQSHGGEKNRLLATYYLGVIRQNANEYLDAALLFRETEPLAEKLEDHRQLSLIAQHLSRIFALNYDHVRALEYAEKALDAAKKAGEDTMENYCKLDVANELINEYRYEEASQLLLPVLQSTPMNHPLYSLLARLMAHVLMYQEHPDPQTAKWYYQTILDTKSISLNSHDYGVLALISEIENESKLADHYLQVANSLIKSSVDSVSFFNDCRNVYAERKDWEKAHDAKTKSSLIQDRTTIDLLAQSLTHVMEEYYKNHWVIEQERSRSRLYLFIIIGTILLATCSAIVFYSRRKNQQILKDMADIQDVSSELVDTLIADKISSLQQLSESYFSWEDSAIRKRESRRGRLTKDELIASFRTQLSGLRNDHSFISAIEKSLNMTENGIMEKARQSLDNEKELDYSILALLFSGFSIKSIGFLLRMSEASLRMRKSRFKKQFESMSEPSRKVFLEKLR